MTANKTETEGLGARSTMVFVALVIILCVAGAWYWNTRKAEASAAETASPVRSTLHLETFVVNLSDPGQRAYLRAGIDLGLGRDLGRNEDAPPVSKIRDTILGVLSQAKVDDLLSEPGKTALKGDVLHALQEKVPAQKVEEVYFTELLVQR